MTDHATATVEVTNDITHVIFRSEDVELHDRLKDLRTGLWHGLTIGGLGGDLESNGRGVNGVERTVDRVTLKSSKG